VERGVLRRSSTIVSTVPTVADRNLIPADRIDPVAARILSYVPAAADSAGTNNFVYNSPSNQDALKGDFRIDQIISGDQNLYFRYGYQKTDNAVTSPLPPDAGGNFYAGGGNDVSTSRSWVFVHNKIWSPTLISSVRAGWNEIAWTNILPDQSLKGVGIPGVNESNPGFSQINITGYRALGVTNVPNQDDSWNRQILGRRHEHARRPHAQGGVQAYLLGIDFLSLAAQQRHLQLQRPVHRQRLRRLPARVRVVGQPVEVRRAELPLALHAPVRAGRLARDAQPDAEPGLRYELSPPPSTPTTPSPTSTSTPIRPPAHRAGGSEGDDRASRVAAGGQLQAVRAARRLCLQPPGRQTVIRGGYGIFYANLITLGGMQSMEINPPNHVRVNQTTSSTGAPTILLSQGSRPTRCRRGGAQRHADLLRPQRQDAHRLPVEPQRAARAARAGGGGGRLQQQPPS
jgi:hypothetical protein